MLTYQCVHRSDSCLCLRPMLTSAALRRLQCVGLVSIVFEVVRTVIEHENGS
jgi:hypothetical protein